MFAGNIVFELYSGFMTQQGQALMDYFVSLALVIQYPHCICRKLSATRDGSPVEGIRLRVLEVAISKTNVIESKI
jgi:hypothetical protein